MNLDRRHTLFFLAFSLQGCGGGHDRQMIYPAPRVSAIRADPSEGARGPSTKGRVLGHRPPSPSNGVDVPIVEQD